MGCRKRRSRHSAQGEPPLTRLPHKLFCSFRLHSKVVELGYKIISQATCLSSLAVQLANWRGWFPVWGTLQNIEVKKIWMIWRFASAHSPIFSPSLLLFFNDSPPPVHKLYTRRRGGVIDSLWKALGEHWHSSVEIYYAVEMVWFIFLNPRVYHCFFNAHIYLDILFNPCKGIRLCPPAAGVQSWLISGPSDQLSGSRVAATELIPVIGLICRR